MTRPDLTDEAKIAAHRAELRMVGRNQRLGGFALVILGAIAVWGSGYTGGAAEVVQWMGYATLAGGWALMMVAIFLRTRYLRSRMREMD
ncbi:MAG: hypothetical protein Q8S53_14150 [Brevundimonas sp.]|uniref:hypothetical protein n=1 Tax=Brevundimonas sp. TaxID=1871086 RepID=UPI0027352846|nr:hypothetical protein [Brevundimonas sp.]MDP3379503.1 hypothetical protein [Brevundimonas sp.]